MHWVQWIGTLAVTFGVFSASAAERKLVDRVVAVIEEDVITLRELILKASDFLEPLDKIEDPKERRAKRREVLAKALDIEIGERLVDREVERNRDRLTISSPDVERAISQVLSSNQMTREQLRSALYGQGMSWSDYESKIREQLARSRLVQMAVQSKIQLEDSDVKRRCAAQSASKVKKFEVCASHILFQIPPTATGADLERIRQRATGLQAELAAGADFAAYAMRHSADKSAPDGGLGCFGRGEMVEEFEKVAFGMQAGEVSSPIKTEFGYHLIKVHERREVGGGDCDDEQVLMSIRNRVYQEQFEVQMDIWLKGLRKKGFVDVRL